MHVTITPLVAHRLHAFECVHVLQYVCARTYAALLVIVAILLSICIFFPFVYWSVSTIVLLFFAPLLLSVPTGSDLLRPR